MDLSNVNAMTHLGKSVRLDSKEMYEIGDLKVAAQLLFMCISFGTTAFAIEIGRNAFCSN